MNAKSLIVKILSVIKKYSWLPPLLDRGTSRSQ